MTLGAGYLLRGGLGDLLSFVGSRPVDSFHVRLRLRAIQSQSYLPCRRYLAVAVLS